MARRWWMESGAVDSVRCHSGWWGKENRPDLRVLLGANPSPTRECRRRPTASARASLPLFAVPDPKRSVLVEAAIGMPDFKVRGPQMPDQAINCDGPRHG